MVKKGHTYFKKYAAKTVFEFFPKTGGSIMPLNKITQVWRDHPFSQRNKVTKRGWGEYRCVCVGGGGQNLKKEG